MPIQWKEEYNLGIGFIDEQHKKFVKILSDLNDSMHHLKTNEVTMETIRQIKDFCVYHMKTEEDLFEKFNYPEKDVHKIEHKKFIDYIENLEKNSPSKDKLEISIDLIDHMEDWMLLHEQNMDKRYVPFLKEHGVQ
jgi:hemerythrin-like metal-binding protein